MEGFINLNKTKGMTSHDCIDKIRKLLHIKKVGHGGTLDPAATGVLPIAIGKATRLLQYLHEGKAYKATIRLGIVTTTDDLEGEIINSKSCNELTLDKIQGELSNFLGKIEQIPPNYSAIHVQGKRLYELARSGQIIDVPSREVEVYKIDILDWRSGEFPEVELEIKCGPGTYIRSIARDLGTRLNVGGTLANLIRSESAGMLLTNSVTLADLENQIKTGIFQPISPGEILSHLPMIKLSELEVKKWCTGQKLRIDQELKLGFIQIYDQENKFLGIGDLINDENGLLIIPKMVNI